MTCDLDKIARTSYKSVPSRDRVLIDTATSTTGLVRKESLPTVPAIPDDILHPSSTRIPVRRKGAPTQVPPHAGASDRATLMLPLQLQVCNSIGKNLCCWCLHVDMKSIVLKMMSILIANHPFVFISFVLTVIANLQILCTFWQF